MSLAHINSILERERDFLLWEIDLDCLCIPLGFFTATGKWGHFLWWTGLSPDIHNDWMLDLGQRRSGEVEVVQKHSSLTAQVVNRKALACFFFQIGFVSQIILIPIHV